MSGELRIGVDLGGTKTEAVVVRLGGDAPHVLARRRIATGAEAGYEHIVAQTRELVSNVARDAGLDLLGDASASPGSGVGVGVGMPGSVTSRAGDGSASPVPLVKNSNTTCLNGRPFHADLAKALGRQDVAFANDANCFALAEAQWGGARGARVAFGVIMGTGVGGGVVFRDANGSLGAWEGTQGIAGEWGHVVLEPTSGPPCYCGRRGCIETYLSGPAIETEYAARSGARLRLPAIAALAKGGDGVAAALIAERVDLFGRAMSVVINVLDPDVIVLGGGVSNLSALYDEGLRAVAAWVFNDELRTRIVKNELGDSAGVLGAALLPRRARDRALQR